MPPLNDILDTPEILAMQDQACRDFFERNIKPQVDEGSDLLRSAKLNHSWNMQLWAEEDLARRLHAPDAEIVANKRAIDKFNQARNNAIEAMDDILIAALPPLNLDARLNSETPGSIIDRLSIGCLKLYHMGVQSRREDASEEHRRLCADKVATLSLQRDDLASCLTQLLAGCLAGTDRFRVYRQFKMYNDATLNPALIAEMRK